MDKLWAPWRIKYIKAGAKHKGCIFCRAKRAQKKNYVIFKTRHSLAMLNIFPYNNGHIMISPLKHTGEISRLSEIEALDLFRSLNKAKRLLEKTLAPDGYNIGINLGRSAGAGIVSHLHIHIVPRWKGDTNFMPVLYGTKIISESLGELHKQLKKALRDAESKRN